MIQQSIVVDVPGSSTTVRQLRVDSFFSSFTMCPRSTTNTSTGHFSISFFEILVPSCCRVLPSSIFLLAPTVHRRSKAAHASVRVCHPHWMVPIRCRLTLECSPVGGALFLLKPHTASSSSTQPCPPFPPSPSSPPSCLPTQKNTKGGLIGEFFKHNSLLALKEFLTGNGWYGFGGAVEYSMGYMHRLVLPLRKPSPWRLSDLVHPRVCKGVSQALDPLPALLLDYDTPTCSLASVRTSFLALSGSSCIIFLLALMTCSACLCDQPITSFLPWLFVNPSGITHCSAFGSGCRSVLPHRGHRFALLSVSRLDPPLLPLELELAVVRPPFPAPPVACRPDMLAATRSIVFHKLRVTLLLTYFSLLLSRK